MKKLALSALVSVTLLTGCAAGDANTAAGVGTSVLTEVGTTLFTQTVDNTCRSQLNAQSMYKNFTSMMTAEQKQALENNVCGCVASEAPKSVSTTEIAQAVADRSVRAQIVGKAVMSTLGTCAQRMFAQ